MIEIKHRWIDEVLFKSEKAKTTAEAVAEAVAADTYLVGANLAGADLADTYLAGANLAGADLADTYLVGATGVPDDKKNEQPQPPLEVPAIPRIHNAILEAIKRPGCALDMTQWHACETTHCRAGWAVTLAGEAGKALEERVGTARAAAMIYRKSDPGCRVPHWFASNERAMADIEACAKREAAQ